MIRDLAKGFMMHGSEMLCKDAGHIPAEKLSWKPDVAGKSVVEIFQECAEGSYKLAAALQGTAWEGKIEDTDFEVLKAKIMEGAGIVCQAIDSLTDEQLGGQVTMPWGQTFPTAVAIFLPSQHLNYHDGQINYIQLLLGDTRFHWMED